MLVSVLVVGVMFAFRVLLVGMLLMQGRLQNVLREVFELAFVALAVGVVFMLRLLLVLMVRMMMLMLVVAVMLHGLLGNRLAGGMFFLKYTTGNVWA